MHIHTYIHTYIHTHLHTCIYIGNILQAHLLGFQVYLRRNAGEPLRIEDRMDTILKKKASEGVKIYVLLWRENVQAVVNNFSQEMKKELKALHPNILCLRHGHPQPLTVYFCHHQKFVVVDQKIAFVGKSIRFDRPPILS